MRASSGAHGRVALGGQRDGVWDSDYTRVRSGAAGRDVGARKPRLVASGAGPRRRLPRVRLIAYRSASP